MVCNRREASESGECLRAMENFWRTTIRDGSSLARSEPSSEEKANAMKERIKKGFK
jgi:hypothetical protein